MKFNILNLFKKKEKIEPPTIRGIIKMSQLAKENWVNDDENKIIELHNNGKVSNIKYTEEDVEVLRENGIPVLPEEYTDEFDFIEAEQGGVETFRR